MTRGLTSLVTTRLTESVWKCKNHPGTLIQAKIFPTVLYLILFNSAQLYHLIVGTLNHAFPCQEEGTKVYNQAYHYWWSNLKRVRKRNGTSLYFANCSRWLLADDVKQLPFPILFLLVSSHPERNRISRCIQNSTTHLAMDDSYLPQNVIEVSTISRYE